MRKKVKHVGPAGAEILILGEAPGADEEYLGLPFIGKSGEFLDHMLSYAGIAREECRVANVLNYRPPDNNFESMRGTPEMEESLEELNSYIALHPPKLILCLGNEALMAIMGFGGISKWRGSVLFKGKSFVLPTYHPAAALRQGDMAPQIVFDFKKAKRVLQKGYRTPVHDFHIQPSDLDYYLPFISSAPFIAVDIESVRDTTHILSIGFAWSATSALVLKNHNPLGEGMEEEFRRSCEAIFDGAKALTFHNGTFDVEVLRINSIPVPLEKYDWDTMFAQRTIAPELPIGLDFCCSIYTDEPYYKDDGKQVGKKVPLTLYTYNATDCIVTWQTRKAQQELMDSSLLWSYKEDHEDILVALDMQKNGLLVDQERLAMFDKAIDGKLRIDATMMFMLAGKTFNYASPKQVKELLYDEFKLPVRKNKKGAVTTDEDAIVSLLQYCMSELESRSTPKGQEPWIKKVGVLKMLLKVRGHEKMLSSYIRFSMSDDGRVRGSYNIAGTETGRWSASLYVDGTGFNPQTLPRESIEV